MDKAERIKELAMDKEFAAGLVENRTAEEAKAYLAKHGIECTDKEVAELGQSLSAAMKIVKDNGGELSEEQLAAIAGGGAGDVTIEIPKSWVTTPTSYALSAYTLTVTGLSDAWEWVKSW